jgi:hypothetical protein
MEAAGANLPALENAGRGYGDAAFLADRHDFWFDALHLWLWVQRIDASSVSVCK